MFTQMTPIKNLRHSARDTEYEIQVYQVVETGEYRIFISKGGFGVGDVFTASRETVDDVKSVSNEDVVQELIDIAISDIDKNEFNLY